MVRGFEDPERIKMELSAELGLYPSDLLDFECDDKNIAAVPVCSATTRAGRFAIVRDRKAAERLADATLKFRFNVYFNDVRRKTAAPHETREWLPLYPLLLHLYGGEMREVLALRERPNIDREYSLIARSYPDTFWEAWRDQDIATLPAGTIGKEVMAWGTARSPTKEEFSRFVHAVARQRAQDPLEYLMERGGYRDKTDAFEQLLKLAPIDSRRVSKEALKWFGFEQFLAADGKAWETPSGFIYFSPISAYRA